VIRKPWPGMLRGIWGDPDRYVKQYWSKYKDIYFTGDGAKIDKDGYFWLLGRVDDVMNVSGHACPPWKSSPLWLTTSLSPRPLSSARPRHQGQAIAAFVTVKGGIDAPRPDGRAQGARARKIGALPGRTISSSRPSCQDPLRQDHAAAAADIAEAGPWRYHDAGRPAVVASLKTKYEDQRLTRLPVSWPVVSAWTTETVRSPGTLPRKGPRSPMVRAHIVVFPSEFQHHLLRLRYGIGVAPTAAPRHTEATQWTSGSGWRRI